MVWTHSWSSEHSEHSKGSTKHPVCKVAVIGALSSVFSELDPSNEMWLDKCCPYLPICTNNGRNPLLSRQTPLVGLHTPHCQGACRTLSCCSFLCVEGDVQQQQTIDGNTGSAYSHCTAHHCTMLSQAPHGKDKKIQGVSKACDVTHQMSRHDAADASYDGQQ